MEPSAIIVPDSDLFVSSAVSGLCRVDRGETLLLCAYSQMLARKFKEDADEEPTSNAARNPGILSFISNLKKYEQ
jgi:hypothetical protein